VNGYFLDIHNENMNLSDNGRKDESNQLLTFAILGLARVTAARKVDFPAFGTLP
jgi:hypothetical protein